jgi:hypothetical protein
VGRGEVSVCFWDDVSVRSGSLEVEAVSTLKQVAQLLSHARRAVTMAVQKVNATNAGEVVRACCGRSSSAACRRPAPPRSLAWRRTCITHARARRCLLNDIQFVALMVPAYGSTGTPCFDRPAPAGMSPPAASRDLRRSAGNGGSDAFSTMSRFWEHSGSWRRWTPRSACKQSARCWAR